jgi:hypothetical protein
MEIYAELVPFDAALAQRMSDRAARVISATEAGELLPRSFTESGHHGIDARSDFPRWQGRGRGHRLQLLRQFCGGLV